MQYKEPLPSKLVFSTRESIRKTKLLMKKFGKAWNNKKEYFEHFLHKHSYKNHESKQIIPPESVESLKKTVAGEPLIIGEDRLAVYTCVFGGYDDVEEPFITGKYCDYYIVTDKKVSEKSKWKQIEPKQFPDGFESWHPAIKNRYFKMHPDTLFSEYKYSLYIDGSIRLFTDMYPFLIQMKNKGTVIGLFDHPCGTCIYSSAEGLIELGLINADEAKAQIKRYCTEGFPEQYGLFECGFILREHHNKKCKAIMDTWWNEYRFGVKRDQMSFTYALWKNGLEFDDVCNFGNNLRKSSRLKEKAHNRPHSKVD